MRRDWHPAHGERATRPDQVQRSVQPIMKPRWGAHVARAGMINTPRCGVEGQERTSVPCRSEEVGEDAAEGIPRDAGEAPRYDRHTYAQRARPPPDGADAGPGPP